MADATVSDTTADGGTPAALLIERGVDRTSVKFEVAGLDDDATGTVRFFSVYTEGEFVDVPVAANGAFAVDLSSLTGTFAAKLLIQDMSGNSASTYGNFFVLAPTGVPRGATITGTSGKDRVGRGVTVAGQPQMTDYGDTVYGLGNADLIDGDTGDDILYGGDGNDEINGGVGSDRIYGEGGNDILKSWRREGPDYLDGGAGTDTLSLKRSYAHINETLDFSTADKIATVQDLGDGTLVVNLEILSITGGYGDDRFVGGAGDDYLYGWQGSDTLIGNGGNDILEGGSGNEIIDGGSGHNQITGDNGNDTITTAEGAVDVIDGGADFDTLIIQRRTSTAGSTFSLKNGPSTTQSLADGTTFVGFERVEFYGGSGNDDVTGGASASLIYGGGGNDKLTGGSSSSEALYGEDGDDTIVAGASLQILDGGNGNDSFFGTSGADSFIGGLGTDSVTYSGAFGLYTIDKPGGNVSSAADGVDTLTGIETLIFSNGTYDWASGSFTSNTTLTLSVGAQSAQLVEAGGAVAGTASATITVVPGDSDPAASPGFDTATLTAAGWTSAGAGKLSKAGTYGSVVLDLGAGLLSYTLDNTKPATDALGAGVLASDAFSISISDTSGASLTKTVAFSISGTDDTPVLTVGAQSTQIVEAGTGTAGVPTATIAITKAGGASFDTAALTAAGWTASGNSFTKTGTYGSALLDTGTGVVSYTLDNSKPATDALAGGAAATDDFVIPAKDGSGNSAAKTASFAITGSDDTPPANTGVTIYGTSGADTITPTATVSGQPFPTIYADTIYGYAGKDVINGGAGADTMIGGLGDDTYTVDDVGDVIVEDLDAGYDSVTASVSYTLGANVDKLTLNGAGAVNGTGNAIANTITGNGNNNTILGLGGNDYLYGVTGNDTLDGGDGADTLSGGDGDDRLTGGAGNDVIDGGNGADTAVYSGIYSNYTIDRAGGTVTSAADGVDKLTGVETLVFSNGTYNWSTGAFTPKTLPTFSAGAQSVVLVEAGSAVAGTVSATMALTLSDADAGDSASFDTAALTAAGWTSAGAGQLSKAGTYGSVVLDLATGVLTYTLDDTRPATDSLAAGASASDQFAITIKETSGAAVTGTVAFSISGTDDAPILTIGSQSAQIVEAGPGVPGTPTATIALTTSDVDTGDSVSFDTAALTAAGWTSAGAGQLSKAGTYGSVVLDLATGLLTYTLDDTKPATNALAAGTPASDGFAVTVRDASGAATTSTATFSISGTNDAPTLTVGAQTTQVVEAGAGVSGTPTATIGVTTADVDTGDGASFDTAALTTAGWTSAGAGTLLKAGIYGSVVLDLATGVLTYTLDDTKPATGSLAAGASATDAFVIASRDISGATATGSATFSISGTNDGPIVTAGAQSAQLVEAGPGLPGTPAATIGLTTSDIDAGDSVSFDTAALTAAGWIAAGAGKLSKDGVYGSVVLDFATGVLTYTLDNSKPATDALKGGTSVSDGFSVTIKDLSGASATTTATFSISGTDDGVTIYGTSGADTITPTATVSGQPFPTIYADTIYGYAGKDVINGGAGADTMIGGLGDDTYTVDDVGDVIVEDLDAGYDSVTASVSYTLGANVDKLTLNGAGAVNGTGNAIANTITGNGNNNTILGLGGNDYLYGVTGNDTLDGGDGNDTLYGGLGNDILTGGAGADKFVFDTAPSSAQNVDTITDFTVADDVFWVKSTVFGNLALGALDASRFAVGAAATTSDQRFVYDNVGGKLSYDADGSGSGASVQIASLGTQLALSASNFTIV